MESIYTDLRVINMKCREKSAIGKLIEADRWVTLGHFDQIDVTPLQAEPENGAPGVKLSRIAQYNQAISLSSDHDISYHRPQYILQEYPSEDSKRIEQFWSLTTAFMVIIRIHSGGSCGQKMFEERIERHLRETGAAVKSYAELPENREDVGEDVFHLSYRTLELSDIILVAKSDSATRLMQLVGQLCYLSCVGDTFSYFCVASSELSDAGKKLACQSDKIPAVITRFAIKDANATHRFLKKYEAKWSQLIDRPIIITGTEDLMLITQKISSASLCEQIRTLHGVAAEEECRSAFDDVMTQLSVYEHELKPPEKPLRDTAIHDEYSRLDQRFHELCKSWFQSCEITDDRPDGMLDWMRPVREYIRSMKTISDDSNLRQTCYTVLDGTRALVRLSDEILSLERGGDKKELRARTKLLRIIFPGISDLIEHMIRMEGELVHYPETRPLLYDIPANLLELYMCLSNRCIKYYQEREDRLPIKLYRLLAVPCLCRTIQVKNTPYDSYADEEALYIEIPLHLLYEPEYAICSLIHEVSHFGGDETRCRVPRFHAFAYCVGFYIASALRMAESDEAVERIVDELENRIPLGERSFMYKLEPALKCAVYELIDSRDFISELSTIDSKGFARREVDKKQTAFILRVMKELRYLFKETYADLAMVNMLELDADDYIRVLKRELRGSVDEATYANAVERAAFVVYTLQKEEGKELQLRGGDPFRKSVRSYIDWLVSSETHEPFGPYYHYFEAAATILGYLRSCFLRMREFDARSENVRNAERIRECFEEFARKSRFASDLFYEELEENRKALLDNR